MILLAGIVRMITDTMIRYFFVFLVFLFLVGCATHTFVEQEPSIDLDENLTSEAVKTIEPGPIPDSLRETEPEPEELTQEPVLSQEQEAPTTASVPKLKDAEEIAKKFANAWSNKQYRIMYTYFAPKLKNRHSEQEFEAIMLLNPSQSRIEEVAFKGLDQQSEKKAILNLKITTNVKSYDLPDAYMVFTNNSWSVDAMDDVFYVDTFGAACGGFSKEFNVEECAKDLAIKLKDTKYCERSECHYTECMETINKELTTSQKVIACNLCPPVGTTTKECIVGVAIEQDSITVCDEIPESSYSDRYCKCYGGFSKVKGQSYCNIAPEEYRDICIKGFEGGYC